MAVESDFQFKKMFTFGYALVLPNSAFLANYFLLILNTIQSDLSEKYFL